MKTYTLMTPGPVPLPAEVLEVLARPMEHHRTPEFEVVFGRVLKNLKKVFMTEQSVFIQTSTGSGGMESALVNCLSPGDEVLAIVSGKFGERWADMAEVFGAKVTRLQAPWGAAVRTEQVSEAFQKNPNFTAVLCQACETSTGVLHPIREIAQIVSQSDAVLMVDAITALGALPLPMDDWGIDVLIGGSQKAFMLPAGLSFISFSKKAWTRVESAKCPRFYFDIRKEKKANDAGESGFSAAVTHIRALDLVLDIFLKEGLQKIYDRIGALSRATTAGIREMGLEIFPSRPSPSLTAVRIPEGIDGQKVRSDMEKDSLVVVMGGQDQLKGKVIRIGHMGAISDQDLISTLQALAAGLNRQSANLVSDAQVSKAIAKAKEILALAPPPRGLG